MLDVEVAVEETGAVAMVVAGWRMCVCVCRRRQYNGHIDHG